MGVLSTRFFVLLLKALLSNTFIIVDWELYDLFGITLVYSIILDWIRCRFLFVVFLISRIVMFYSDSYMSHEKTKNAFAWIVFLFVISMMFLIIRPNLIRVILGWDGLGLVSYLLVIYYQNYKSYSAGILTCLSNRIGDRAILISIGWILSLGRLDFIAFKGCYSKELLVATSFVIIAAMTKSAQIPFSSWLPAAIAAPTPVSALVHSSTLVTAGVFLLIRFFPLISLVRIKDILFISAALTMTISSLGALYETDLKKIIALSTLSQLGLMMMALRIDLYLLAFFHLLTHALFKASLFLCAGRIIHLFNGRQDIRNLNIVTSYMPFTTTCLLICSLSLGGFPFLAAFYSKDKIIEERFSSGYNFVCLLLLLMSIILTLVYSFRLIYYICIENYDIRLESTKDDGVIARSIGVLTLGGIIGGRGFSWLIFIGCYDNLYRGFKLGILFFLILGFALGVLVKFNRSSLASFYFSNIWFLPAVSTKLVRHLSLAYGKTVRKFWDHGWNETLGPKGLSNELKVLALTSDKITHSSIKSILWFSFVIILILLLIFCYYSLHKAWCWSHQEDFYLIAFQPWSISLYSPWKEGVLYLHHKIRKTNISVLQG